MSGPELSVVVATHNRAQRLDELLTALEAQTLAPDRFEVVVVDDGSRDSTPEVLAAERTITVRTLVHPQGRGPATARNRGWRQATAERIVFTDDDCVPSAGWLDALLAVSRERPELIVQGRTLPNPAEARGLGAFAKTLEVSEASPHYETANILYPRAVLERLDGFDEHYSSAAGEDTDLGWRARATGVEAVFEADALVHHAVHARGAMNSLRDALRATDCVRPYHDHPQLRESLAHGLFFDRSHPLLMQAALAAVLARRAPAAMLFAAPYALHLSKRCRKARAPLHMAPFFVARDVVEIAATARGALRHRVAVL
jgi:glycosyltransferase involved in cell wall biosynthesis